MNKIYSYKIILFLNIVHYANTFYFVCDSTF